MLLSVQILSYLIYSIYIHTDFYIALWHDATNYYCLFTTIINSASYHSEHTLAPTGTRRYGTDQRTLSHPCHRIIQQWAKVKHPGNTKKHRETTHRKKVSRSLWPPPSIQKGLARYGGGIWRKRDSPLVKGTTSSQVPWRMKMGQAVCAMRSTLANKSQGKVRRKGNATRNIDKKGLYR